MILYAIVRYEIAKKSRISLNNRLKNLKLKVGERLRTEQFS